MCMVEEGHRMMVSDGDLIQNDVNNQKDELLLFQDGYQDGVNDANQEQL